MVCSTICLTLTTSLHLPWSADCWEDKDVSHCRAASTSPRKPVPSSGRAMPPKAPATDLTPSLSLFLSLFSPSSHSPPVSFHTKMRTQLIQAKWGRERRRRRRRPGEPGETENKQEGGCLTSLRVDVRPGNGKQSTGWLCMSIKSLAELILSAV